MTNQKKALAIKHRSLVLESTREGGSQRCCWKRYDDMFSSDKRGVRSAVAINLEEGKNMTGISAILERMMGDSQCLSLLLDLTNDADNVLRFVDKSYLYFWPTVRVLVVGSKGNMKTFLRNVSLRNTLRTYYLSLDERTITTLRSLSSGPRSNNSSRAVSDFATKLARNRVDFNDGVVDAKAEIYFRCMYCKKGNPGIKKLHHWNLTETLGPISDFPDETKNFNGHQFNIICKQRIPLTDIDKNWGGPAGTVGPLDSLDVRINYAASGKLNFTYLLREPWDGEWGLLGSGGNFTGVVGTLQYEKADFSFMLTATPGRTRVMDYSRVYAGDPYVIVSLKPQALPRYLAIIRPFTFLVWSCIIISCIFAAVVLWLIEKIRWSFSRAKAMSLTNSLLYTVRMILINAPDTLPTHLASQFLFGIWSVASLVIFTAYQSALIAHLTVVIRSSAINTFEDLYKTEGQRWGWIEYSGTAIAYLAENPDPIVQEIYKKLEIHPLEKQMDLILAGHYSHVTRKTIVWVDFLKAERRGLPVHMSTTEYPVFGGYGWGFRKGAPFRDAIDKMKQRLIEAGLIDRWLNEVIKVQVEVSERKEFNGSLITRQANEKVRELGEDDEDIKMLLSSSQEQRALSLESLQGSFYLAIIGYWIAVLVLLLEITRRYYTS
ncbi:glutamate receptor-like [Macrobrachium rosenbergii]|uniref:glutamate receptor-like n=1 Tax=Macrobrachium rosenbergii TaxID=79674 RepID=UPI0034D4FB80